MKSILENENNQSECIIESVDKMARKVAEMPELMELYPNDVYPPSDDTFLFLDALQDELLWLNTKIRPNLVVEIG